MRIYSLLTLLTLLSYSSSNATSLDVKGVTFRSKHPTAGESLEAAIAPGYTITGKPLDQLDFLRTDAKILVRYRDLRVEVSGHADSLECSGAQCHELSLRRATLVRDFLISHGVNASQIALPIGCGTMKPRVPESESDREFNRRADVEILN